MVPVLILQHYRENLKKCSLTPIRGVEGLEFRRVNPARVGDSLTIAGGLVLAMDSPPLTRADRARLDEIPGGQLILIDGNWAKIPFLLHNLELGDDVEGARELPVSGRLLFRSLPASIRTAYPRRSKLHEDPEGGLASVEALVAALHLLGEEATHLLEGYHWRQEFLELNREFFRRSSPADAASA